MQQVFMAHIRSAAVQIHVRTSLSACASDAERCKPKVCAYLKLSSTVLLFCTMMYAQLQLQSTAEQHTFHVLKCCG
jgi:hypothetical protein